MIQTHTCNISLSVCLHSNPFLFHYRTNPKPPNLVWHFNAQLFSGTLALVGGSKGFIIWFINIILCCFFYFNLWINMTELPSGTEHWMKCSVWDNHICLSSSTMLSFMYCSLLFKNSSFFPGWTEIALDVCPVLPWE